MSPGQRGSELVLLHPFGPSRHEDQRSSPARLRSGFGLSCRGRDSLAPRRKHSLHHWTSAVRWENLVGYQLTLSRFSLLKRFTVCTDIPLDMCIILVSV